MSVLVIHIFATLHRCVYFVLSCVQTFQLLWPDLMTSWKWQGMGKSKHISFNCSVQTKSLNSNDISCQIITYLCNEKIQITVLLFCF